MDIFAWYQNLGLFRKLVDFTHYFPNGPEFSTMVIREATNLKEATLDKTRLFLGRLSVKEEAAGKARVFAIADSITQAVMSPLHKSIFSLLEKLPQDGTLNQSAPLTRLRSLAAEGKFEGQQIYSYDLSAATDRLPIDLQAQVLSLYFNEDFASL